MMKAGRHWMFSTALLVNSGLFWMTLSSPRSLGMGNYNLQEHSFNLFERGHTHKSEELLQSKLTTPLVVSV